MKNNKNSPAIVLDCDIRSQEGIIQSLGKRDIPIIALSSKKKCPVFKSKFVSDTIVTPDINQDAEEYINFLNNLNFRGVLVYSNDVSAVSLSRNREYLIQSGFLLNLPNAEILEKVFDKFTCFNLAQSMDIPFPKTQLINSPQEALEVWDNFNKPLILKGTRMAGGNYVKINNKEQLEEAYSIVKEKTKSKDYESRQSEIIIQEWLNYSMTDIWHCETVYNTNFQPMGFFPIKNIRTSFSEDGNFGSRLYAGEYAYSREVIESTRKLLSSINWNGFANVDYVYVPEQEKYYLLDVNPRLPGFSFYPSKAGYEMAWYYYSDLTSQTYSIPDKFHKSFYFESFRYPGDISDGINYIFKGYISTTSFIKSYLRAIFSKHQIIIEPIKLDDLRYTLTVQIDNIKMFIVKLFYYLKKLLKNRKHNSIK